MSSVEMGRVSEKLPPPRDFKLLRSEVISAWYAGDSVPNPPERSYSGPQRNGLRYERRVQRHLSEQFGKSYLGSRWIYFREAHAPEIVQRCQPDGLLIHSEKKQVTIVEIKHSHTQRAWWQLRKLYQPVLEVLYPEFSVQVCEVTRFYDRIPFNEPVELVREIDYFTSRFKVHILKP